MKVVFDKLKKTARVLAGSYVVCAFLALIVFDLGARLAEELSLWPISPYQTAHRSWIWWSTVDFVNQKKPPDVVLLGSSLMMAALHGGDAAHLDQPQKTALHNRSRLFESLLSDKLHKQVSTFAFAQAGEMASDAYVIARTMLAGERRPRAIIYGIAPRDFMDNTISSPASSQVFKYMERVGDLTDLGIPARRSFWERAEYLGTRASFIYEHRPDFVHVQHAMTKGILGGLGINDLDAVHSIFHIRKQSLAELPEDAGPDEVIIHPPVRGAQPEYTDNSAEYRSRYAAFKEKQFKEQLSYLERLLALTSDLGVDVILVNMPLTPDNVKMMPPGLYDRYMKSVASISQKYQSKLIDLNASGEFPQKYFYDTVHLNANGGKQFFEILTRQLFNDSSVASTMQKIAQ